ncbi:unnamed protein product [Lathyrus oleraceus]
MKVSKLGEPPIDGKADTNPEGLTDAYGKWSSTVSEILLAGGLSCKEHIIEGFMLVLWKRNFIPNYVA